MNRILSRLLFLLLLPGAACSRNGDGPERPVSSVRIETRNGEKLIDLNLFAFDVTTGVSQHSDSSTGIPKPSKCDI